MVHQNSFFSTSREAAFRVLREVALPVKLSYTKQALSLHESKDWHGFCLWHGGDMSWMSVYSTME